MNDTGRLGQTVVILTALDIEYEAVRRHLTDVRKHYHEAGTRYEVGTLRGSRTRVALVLTGKGNLVAAALTERSIVEFRPVALLFVGVAGGLKDFISLGDIVVAEHVYAYHGGRQDPGEFRPYPRVWQTSHGLSQAAHYVNRAGAWMSFLAPGTQRRPTVHFAPIAAGEVVLNSPDAPLAQQLRQHYSDSAAIEMESGGVASAGHLNRSTPVLTIRGVSDTANGGKDHTDRQGWQPRAAANAAAFAMGLVAELGRTKPALARRPWVLSGLGAVVVVAGISALLAGFVVAGLAAVAAVSFWLAALAGFTTRRWHSRWRAAGVLTAAVAGIASVIIAVNITEQERPRTNPPVTIQQKSGYELHASSDPTTNHVDKVDLDTGCPGWGPMRPRVGTPRCGDLADLIIESTDLHSPDYKPRIVVLSDEQPASFETCRDRLASPAGAAGSVELSALHAGTALCVGTDEGNVASVRITDSRPGGLVFDLEVWQP